MKYSELKKDTARKDWTSEKKWSLAFCEPPFTAKPDDQTDLTGSAHSKRTDKNVKHDAQLALHQEHKELCGRSLEKPVFESFEHSDIHIYNDCVRNSAFWGIALFKIWYLSYVKVYFTKLYCIVNNRCLFVYADILLNSVQICRYHCKMFTDSLFLDTLYVTVPLQPIIRL